MTRWTWRVRHAVPGSVLATLAVIAALAMIKERHRWSLLAGRGHGHHHERGLIDSWVLLVEIKR